MSNPINPDPAASHAAKGDWFSPRRFALLIAGFLFAMFPQVFLGEQTFFFRDYGMFGYPLAHYHRECFWRGELPLWNPLNDCGTPFLAQWNTITLYPGSLIYLLLPMPWSLSFYCLAHLFWAALGMYWLARHWTGNPTAAALAGAAFAFNGLALNCLMWPNNVACYAWMPWVFYFALRAWREGGRRVVLAALVGALQMLAGTPEILLMTWLMIGAVWVVEWFEPSTVRKSHFLRFAGLIALISGLVAVQVLPFAEFLRHAQRSAGYSDDSWAMPPWGWANLLVPHFYTWRWSFDVLFQVEQGWTSSYYPGVGILLLGALAWRARSRTVLVLSVMAILALILSLGTDGHLYAWIKRVLPQIGIVRFPVKFVVFALFLLPLLGAIAWTRITAANPGAWRRDRKWLLGLALVFVTLMAGIAAFAAVFPYGNSQVNMSALSRAGIVAVAVMSIMAWRKFELARPQLGLLLMALLWLDVLTHVPNQNPTVEPWVFEPGLTRQDASLKAGQARLMSRHDTEYRIQPSFRHNPNLDLLSKRSGAYFSCNLLDGTPKLTGMFSLHTREMYDLQAMIYDQPGVLPDGLADFMGVAFKPRPGAMMDFVPRQGALPLATAGQTPVFLEPPQTLAAITASNFNPRAIVFLPPSARWESSVTNATRASVQIESFAAERIVLKVEAEAPTWVVLAQNYYPAWKARVGDRAAPIRRANYTFQAVEVPAGKHTVTLVYQDQVFRFGLGLSLFTFAVCTLCLLRDRKRCQV